MQKSPRRESGSQIVEFGAGLVLLVAVVFLPLLDLTIIPIRWMMSQEIVDSYARKAAMSERFSLAVEKLNNEPSLQTSLKNLGGVTASNSSVLLRITRISRLSDNGKFILVEKPGSIPPGWLPDGVLAPCDYSLVVEVKVFISPAVMLKWEQGVIPGLNAPIPITLRSTHEWVNLGKDPSSNKFFLAE